MAELCQLAEYCNYGDSLNKMLRDRLVVGVNRERIQEKLLAKINLIHMSVLWLLHKA